MHTFPNNTIVSSTDKKNPVIMAKGYADEPAKLYVISAGGQHVELTGADATKSIGFPRSYVYHYDENLFKKLLRAYEKGNKDQLSELWQQAESF